MKKIILTVIVIIVFSLALISCTGSDVKVNEQTTQEESAEILIEDAVEYAKAEDVYFYRDLFSLLKGNSKKEMAIPYSVEIPTELWNYDGKESTPSTIHSCQKAEAYIDESIGYPFAAISSKMNTNPFENFNTMLDNGWVKKEAETIESNNNIIDQSGVTFDFSNGNYVCCGSYMEYNQPLNNDVNEQFEYSYNGCNLFIEKLGVLEQTNVNTKGIISAFKNVAPIKTYYSEKDDCYYAYLIEYDTSYAFVTALYFRSSDKVIIDDVTAQIMLVKIPWGNCSAGVSLTMAGVDAYHDLGIFSFIMGIEQTLGGQAYYNTQMIVSSDNYKNLVVPKRYESRKYSAELQHDVYRSNVEYKNSVENAEEYFDVYTYSIKLKK